MQKIILLVFAPILLATLAFFLYSTSTMQQQTQHPPPTYVPVSADASLDTPSDTDTAFDTLRNLYTDLVARFDANSAQAPIPIYPYTNSLDSPTPTPITNITSFPHRSHSSLTNLTNSDDHTQYLYGSGRAGGQTLVGGINANDILTLQSSTATTGTTSTAKALKVVVGSGGETEAFTILNNGNIGISNLNPTTTLDISGSLKATGLTFPTGAVAGYVLTTDANGVASWTDVSSSAGPWSLTGNNIYPDSTSNNLAIGATDSGSAKLYVNGNVGIGNTAPGYALDVTGTGRFTGALTLGTVASLADNNAVLTTDSGVVKYIDTSAWDKNASNDVTTFLGLTDTPDSYSGQGSKYVRVNSGATALEFADLSASLLPAGTEGQMLYNDAGTWTAHSGMFWDDQNSRLGIGTTLPQSKLSVAGAASLGSTYAGLAAPSNGLIVEGSVGIGTTNPSSLLHLDIGSAASNVGGLSLTQGATTLATLTDASNSSAQAIFQMYSAGTETIRLYANSSFPSYINAGNVGIGTTSPGSKLEIVSGSSAGLNEALRLSGGATAAQSGPSLVFRGLWGAPASLAEIGGVYNNAANYGGDMIFRTSTSGLSSLTERMRIDMYGNVGVGTTAPGASLNVVAGAVGTVPGLIQGYSSGQTADLLQIAKNPGATPSFVFTSAGNLGIGTTSPLVKLHVGNASVSTGLRVSQTVSQGWGNYLADIDLEARGSFGVRLTGYDNDLADGYPLYMIDENSNVDFFAKTPGDGGTAGLKWYLRGNVGIGTTSPGASLNVVAGAVGTVPGLIQGYSSGQTADLLQIAKNPGATPSFVFTSAGNLGIGTTAPSTKLDVNGNLFVGSGSFQNTGGWNAVIDIYQSTNARQSIRTGTVELYLMAHHNGFWGSPVEAAIIGTGGNDALSFGTNATTRMTILGDGNVGIGTTSPLAKLHVGGNCVTGDTMLPIRRRRKRKIGDGEEDDDEGDLDSYGEVQWVYFLCRIDEILPGDEVLSLNEEYWDTGAGVNDGALEYARIHKMMDMGVHDVYELTTKSGRKIRTTAEHPYLIKVSAKGGSASG